MRTENDATISLARELALKHISSDVERGISEIGIAQTYGGASCPAKFGGKFGAYRVDIISGGKILVSEILGKKCQYFFSLHELYTELKSGLMRLI